MNSFVRRFVLFVAVSAVSIAFDQWTKQIATAALKGAPVRTWLNDMFRLQYATNEGAFLSLGANLPPDLRHLMLTIGVGALLLALAGYALFGKNVDEFQTGSYALIASGGFSNWVDRARFDGVVVDFMNMGIGSLRTGVFNVADLAILIGIGLLFMHQSKLDKAKKAAQLAPASPAAPVEPKPDVKP